MWEAVWGGCEPQLWCNWIISPPKWQKKHNMWPTWLVEWWRCTHMPVSQHTNTSNTFYMCSIDVRSSLRWMWASTIMQWHNFHSTSDPEFQNLGPTWPVYWYKGAPIFPWGSMSMAQTLWICLAQIWEAVWGGYQPQPWRNGIISAPQVTHKFKIWDQLS